MSSDIEDLDEFTAGFLRAGLWANCMPSPLYCVKQVSSVLDEIYAEDIKTLDEARQELFEHGEVNPGAFDRIQLLDVGERWEIEHGDSLVIEEQDQETGGLEHLEIDAEDTARVRAWLAPFLALHQADVAEYVRRYDEDDNRNAGHGSAYNTLGYDLWMSAAGHGCGFTDNDHGELGERLHKAAKSAPWRGIEGSALLFQVDESTAKVDNLP